MPDKWEYPWYAAWDLAFHVITLNQVDPDFAKQQLALMLTPRYLHPNGQIPAYEWNFSDVNPPVHAWAAWFIYMQDKARYGKGDLRLLEYIFEHLLMNFTWWVNRKDPQGSNLFEGGFLGLDNIGVFDRSAPLPPGARLEQADGTAWMAFYCQMMLQISLELARHDPVYQSLAAKFYKHFLLIAGAMDSGGHGNDLWDEEDGFFYDALVRSDGTRVRIKVRSIVGLLAIAASTVFPGDEDEALPQVAKELREFRNRHAQLERRIVHPERQGHGGRRLLALLNDDKLRRILRYMLDENEFLSPFGIRAVSRVHRDYPYVLRIGGQELRVDYEPAESTTGMFGGNSNWRGLQQQGFDFTYDKTLYDRLRSADAGAVRGHLGADAQYQHHSARFIENHDEPRAAAVFERPTEEAAAVLALMAPGLRFVHEGQTTGRCIRTSNHLRRRAVEPVDRELESFYQRLLTCMRREDVHDGHWQLANAQPAWDGNTTCGQFVAYTWERNGQKTLVAVNYAPQHGQCYLRLPYSDLSGKTVELRDCINPNLAYTRKGDDLAREGLYLDVPPWRAHVFNVESRAS
jgi:hypothetical protein